MICAYETAKFYFINAHDEMLSTVETQTPIMDYDVDFRGFWNTVVYDEEFYIEMQGAFLSTEV